MAFQRVPNTAKFTLRMSRGSPYPGDYPVLSSVYVRNTIDARTTAYFTGIAGSLNAWWNAQYRARVPDAITMHGVDYQDLNAEFGETGTVANVQQGTNIGVLAAGFAAVLVTHLCSPGAPPKSGRSYWGPVTEADMQDSGDALTQTAVDAWQAVADALEAAATPNAFDAMVIPSRFQNNALRDPAVTNTVINSTVNALVATQTRRRRLR